jgi:hypothetical protein
MVDPVETLERLPEGEISLLRHVADGRLISVKPGQMAGLVGLMAKGLLEVGSSASGSEEIPVLSKKGASVVGVILAERECPPT